MNKKYALFGAAAALAIAGVVYMGTGSNLQASVGTITDRTSRPKVVAPVYDGGTNPNEDTNKLSSTSAVATIPTVVYPGLEKEVKAFQDSAAALEKKIQKLNPSTGSERKVYYLGHGLCVSVGPLGGNPHYFAC